MEIFRTVPNRREVLVTGLLLLCDDLCLLKAVHGRLVSEG